MNKSKIMITRSSNFIGRDLVKQLEQNEEFEKTQKWC
jgi:hypothetical protein